MYREMKNPHGLKFRYYTDHMIDLKNYFSVLPVTKAGDKICETDLNEILLNRMSIIWSRQAYIDGFEC